MRRWATAGLIKHRCAYDASVFAQEEELHRQRREKNLRKQAALFGFELTPLQRAT